MRPAASIGIRDRGIPHSPPCERLSTEAVPMPPPYTSARQQFEQVTVPPRLEQARQADRCTNDVTSGWLVDPYPPDHAAKPLRVFLHELGVDGDLSPSILDWREVLHAIVHDCLKQPFEPCAPRFHVNRRRDQYRDHIIERVVDDPAKDARGRVDVLQGRPKSFNKRDDSLSCKFPIRLGDGLDLADRLFEPLAGQGGAAPAVGVGTKPRLKSPPV